MATENFSIGIKDTIEGLVIDRMDRNQSIVAKYLDEPGFRKVVSELLARRIYDEVKEAG